MQDIETQLREFYKNHWTSIGYVADMVLMGLDGLACRITDKPVGFQVDVNILKDDKLVTREFDTIEQVVGFIDMCWDSVHCIDDGVEFTLE